MDKHREGIETGGEKGAKDSDGRIRKRKKKGGKRKGRRRMNIRKGSKTRSRTKLK